MLPRRSILLRKMQQRRRNLLRKKDKGRRRRKRRKKRRRRRKKRRRNRKFPRLRPQKLHVLLLVPRVNKKNKKPLQLPRKVPRKPLMMQLQRLKRRKISKL